MTSGNGLHLDNIRLGAINIIFTDPTPGSGRQFIRPCAYTHAKWVPGRVWHNLTTIHSFDIKILDIGIITPINNRPSRSRSGLYCHSAFAIRIIKKSTVFKYPVAKKETGLWN